MGGKAPESVSKEAFSLARLRPASFAVRSFSRASAQARVLAGRFEDFRGSPLPVFMRPRLA